MSFFDALLGRIFSRGTELELGSGLDFKSPLSATPNAQTGLIDIEAPTLDSVAVFNVLSYGAAASASGAINTAAIQAAIVAANAAGGGRVFIPEGTFTVAGIGGNIALSLTGLANVKVQGVGAGLSVLKLAAAADSNVINIDGATDLEICDLTIDGTRASQTVSVHGVRTGPSGCDGLKIHDVEVKECYGYGIGLQGGTKRRVFLDRIYVHDTGSDAIDSKNTDDDNGQLFASNIFCENYGLNGALTVQAGFDCRGPWQLTNIETIGSASDSVGVRFREGELLDASGFGSHHSKAVNLRCTGSGGTSIGIDIAARDVSVVGAEATGCFRGVSLAGARTQLRNIDAHDNDDDGILVAAGADDSTLMGITSIDNGDDGITVRADRVRIGGGSVITGNTGNGIALESGADSTRIDGVRLASNGAALDDAGTNTLIGPDNDGLGGRFARTVDENVVSTATSANIDVPILASKTYLFRLRAIAEDSNGDRATKIVLIETLRSGSGAPATPTQGSFFVSGDGVNLTVNNTISGNNLRLSVTNGMGQDCRLTTVVEEIYRDTTAEDS